MERYFTQVTHTDLTDRLCEATLRTVVDNARLALADPHDYDARAELMWAGALAHNNLLGTGREGDWASHMIEHELSGFYDVAHGAGLAVVFPAWMRHVYRENLGRFVQFAVRVWDVDFPFENQERIALEGIRRLTSFFGELGLPTTLGELGVGTDKFDEMAERGTARGAVGSFRKIDANGVREILRLAS
jgi:alcohol dehydrogenase